MKTNHIAMLAACAALGLGTTAQGHHSTAMFDFSKKIEVTGTVKDFEWTNPHTWTNVRVEGGRTAGVYGLEGMSPNYLARNGWTKRTFNPGDRVTLKFAPLRNGEPGGYFLEARLADGKVMTYTLEQ